MKGKYPKWIRENPPTPMTRQSTPKPSLSFLREAESFLGKKAIMEQVDVPGSCWTRAIKSLKSRDLVVQRGVKAGATYGLSRPLGVGTGTIGLGEQVP